MLEINEIIKELNKIMIARHTGEQVDFSDLRKSCKMFNDRCVVKPVFECDGTDQQLWESVTTYFHKLLKKS